MSHSSTRQRRDRPRTSDRRSDGRGRSRDASTATDCSSGPGRPTDRLRDRIGDRGVATALVDTERSGAESGRERAVGRVADLLATEAGRPLPPTTRREMAKRFGHDFGGVRLHDGPAAARTTRDLDAAAYTVGPNVVFGDGFDPARLDDRLLLAHELAHVVQRADSRTVRPGVSDPEDRIETAAARAALDVALGEKPTLQPYPVPVVVRAETEWWQDLYNYGGTGAGVLSLVNDVAGSNTGAGGALGLLGFASGVAQMADPESSTADVVMGGASAYSGGIGFLGSLVPSLGAGGTTGVSATALGSGALGSGGAWSGLGALGSAGAVIGSGLAGYGAGRLLDEGVGGLMNWSGASDWLDEQQGISRPEGQHGDYSISGMGSSHMVAKDQAFTEVMRSVGAYDESKPAYTQTLGWQLAEVLPSWMQ